MPKWSKTKIDENGRECTRCKEYKLRSGYYTSARHSSGYQPHCRACAMAYLYFNRSYKGNQEMKQMMKKKWGVGKVSGFVLPKK